MENKKKNKRRFPAQFYSLTFKIISYVFILTIIMITIALSIMAVMYYSGLFDGGEGAAVSPVIVVIILVVVSSIIGALLAIGLYSLSFKEFNQFQAAMSKVAKGDFSVTLPDNEDNYMYELNSSFNAMVKSLKSIETLKTDFISDFSHEFKTPIASICGFAKLLASPNISEEEKQEYINIIISESNRLTQLSKNTLSLSKLDNQEAVYEKVPYSLDEQLRKCALMFQTEMDGKQIDLSLLGEDIVYCGNEELTQQLWINLIGNAVKFTPNGGSIEISVAEEDANVVVSVKDTGCGMDEETKRRIFDKFFQGDPSRSVSGNGLGLSIVSKILQIVGGDITVESEPDKGSVFTVTLPNRPPAAEPAADKSKRKKNK